VGDTGLEPVTPSLSSTGRRDVSGYTTRLTVSDVSGCPNGCPSSQVWLHEDEFGVSPVETMMVMIEELLQSAVANDCFRLSLVLADENDAIRINTTAMPNGIVYSQVAEAAQASP
jgi:dissimilatory sulfite reductase (desulfoviridin) alpha/beta subunit